MLLGQKLEERVERCPEIPQSYFPLLRRAHGRTISDRHVGNSRASRYHDIWKPRATVLKATQSGYLRASSSEGSGAFGRNPRTKRGWFVEIGGVNEFMAKHCNQKQLMCYLESPSDHSNRGNSMTQTILLGMDPVVKESEGENLGGSESFLRVPLFGGC